MVLHDDIVVENHYRNNHDQAMKLIEILRENIPLPYRIDFAVVKRKIPVDS
jgi:hypothetical protein